MEISRHRDIIYLIYLNMIYLKLIRYRYSFIRHLEVGILSELQISDKYWQFRKLVCDYYSDAVIHLFCSL